MTLSFFPDRIQWHEGMLLAPQHFQQESARVDALVAWHALAADPLAWGVRRLEIDEGLLPTGLLRVLRLEAVMPDGMAVCWSAQEAGGHELQLDLRPWATALQEGELPVFLTLGRSARMAAAAGTPARFRGLPGAVVEDEVSQAEPVEVPRAAPNLALAAGEVPPSAFVSLRLMTVRKSDEVFRRGAFVPALLAMEPDHPLHARAASLAAQMRGKAAFLARQTATPSSRVDERLALLEQKARLSALTQALPALEAVLRAPSVRPFALYLALCAQLGPLASLRPGAVPLLPPPWRHEDPCSALEPVLDSLEDFAGEVSQEWRTQLFDVEDGVFSLAMQPQWLRPRLVVGLRGEGESELAAWMAGAVIGSRTLWTTLTERRVLGAPRQAVQDAPELGLRSGAGYLLFAIDATAHHVVADQPLVIGNALGGAAPRPREVVLFIKG